MRKHFLILMLLTLLPLAGWSQIIDISTGYDVQIGGTGAFVYTGVDQLGNITLSVKKTDAEDPLNGTTDYDLKFYGSNGTTVVTEVKNAGDYFVSAVGKGNYTGETPKVAFSVNKATVKYTLKESETGTDAVNNINFTATYKKENFGERAFVIENVKLTEDAVGGETVAELFDVASTATWSYTGTNANWKADGTAPLTAGDKGYQVSVTGITPKSGVNVNYDFAYDPNYVKIKQAVIDVTSEDFTVANGTNPAVDTPEYTYNAENQTPVYTIKYQYGTASTAFETLEAGTHFGVAYKLNGGDVTATKDASTYNYVAYATTKANTNFVVHATLANTKLGEFKINKKPLTVSIKPDSKIYDGEALTADDLDQTKIRYSGLAGNDGLAAADNFPNATTGIAEVTLAFADGVTDFTNAGDKALVVKCVATPTSAIKNYDVTWMTNPVYYTQEEVDEHNASLGAITASTFTITTESTPSVTTYNTACGTELTANTVLTPEQIAAYNATITELWSTETVKTAAAPTITGKYTIERRPVTVSLEDISYERGDAILTAAAGAAQDIDLDVKENATDTQYNVTIQPEEDGAGVITGQDLSGALKITLAKGTYSNVGPYAGKISLAFTFNHTVGKNYKVNGKYTATSGTKVEVATSALNVSAEKLNLYVDMMKKEYGYALNTADFEIYALNKAGDEVALTGAPTFVVYKDEQPVAANTVLGVGSYTVKVDAASLDNVTAANYDIDASKVTDNVLVITKKKVTVTVNPLTLNAGTKTSVMRTYASVVDYKSNMVGTEDIAFEYYYNTTEGDNTQKVAVDDATADDPALNSAAGSTYTKGIHARLLTSASLKKNNDNYEVTFTYGALTVVAATDLVLNDKDQNLSAKILAAHEATVATPGTKYNVKFSTRELQGNLWNVMVLPFDIKVADLSKEFGYAVVDILDITSTTDAHFVLHLGTIPANVPFMIKVAETINLAGNATAEPAVAAKMFDQQVIKYAANADENLTILENGNSCVTDAAGNKLIGTYVKTATNKATDRVIGKQAGDTDNGWWPYSTTIEPLRAILQLGNVSARILIDEEDGTTTEISTITSEGKAMPVEGWYTLNGVKLQGMPTEKGIYINNGKKVVVK